MSWCVGKGTRRRGLGLEPSLDSGLGPEPSRDSGLGLQPWNSNWNLEAAHGLDFEVASELGFVAAGGPGLSMKVELWRILVYFGLVRQLEPLMKYVGPIRKHAPRAASCQLTRLESSTNSSTYLSNFRPACCKHQSLSSASVIIAGPAFCQGAWDRE
ncbi:hypothetical protein ROHU_001631 [Labeo rohita]|uniref:Uncharacterized protein n=1 Tax=Labeo rohita TaxID=84645 RepID=A0A498P0Y6_LABRO|nr:hypothetical protein ROHU_001631 [Labeo rohita]